AGQAQRRAEAALAVAAAERAEVLDARIGDERSIPLEHERAPELRIVEAAAGVGQSAAGHCASSEPLSRRFTRRRTSWTGCGEQAAFGDRVVPDSGQEGRVGNSVTRGSLRESADTRVPVCSVERIDSGARRNGNGSDAHLGKYRFVADDAGGLRQLELMAAAERSGLIVAIGVPERLLLGIFGSDRDVRPVVGEIMAGDEPDEGGPAIPP